MDASRLTFLLIRTAAVFVVAVVFAVLTGGWSTLTTTAVVLTGSAAVVQLGGVLYLRQQERQTW